MNRIPADIDDYLSTLDDEKRAALETLRRTIKAAVPRAEECISYQIPAFRLDGRVLVFFAAAANHCSFFPGAHPIEALKDELKQYKLSKGTIRFDPARPLPRALVRKVLAARIEEQARAAADRARRASARKASGKAAGGGAASGKSGGRKTAARKPR
jgi:uncharacterized protein YdhG (YjbR/CyaY superfamily)